MGLLKPTTTKSTIRKTKATKKGATKKRQATAQQHLDDEIMNANNEQNEEDDDDDDVPPLPPPIHSIMPPSTTEPPSVLSNPPMSDLPPPRVSPVSSNPPMSNMPPCISSNPPILSNPPISYLPPRVSSNPDLLPPVSSNPPIPYLPPCVTSNPPIPYLPPCVTSNSPISYLPPRVSSNPEYYRPTSTPSYPPFSFTGYNYYPPLYPPSSITTYSNHRLDTIKRKLSSLEERIALLEGSSATSSDETTFNSDVPGITREKMAAINIILSNKALGWKAALRKILVAVLGVNELSQSCARGKKNAKNRSLDSQLVRSVTGKYIFTTYTYYYPRIIFVDILYQRYGDSSVDLRPETINTVINSACSGARRALKDCPPCP